MKASLKTAQSACYFPSEDNAHIANVQTLPKQWLANFYGEFVCTNNGQDAARTHMGKTMHYGPLRVQRPFFPEGQDLIHLYLLHPPGGLVGGDRLSIEIKAHEGAKVLVTTPSAGKIYRNESEHLQGQFIHIQVAQGACVEYLPQENIIFNGAKTQLNTQVDLQGNGLYVGWEITCLGRAKSNETFENGSLRQALNINRDGAPIFTDRFIFTAPSIVQASLVGLQQQSVFGTFVITQDIEINLGQCIADIEKTFLLQRISVTQKPGVWIARVLGHDPESLRAAFEALWAEVRPDVLQRPACTPRIWNT